MNYRINHTTTYSYATPASVCHNSVMLSPRDSSRVVCHSHRITVRPTPQFTHRRHDFFGNNVNTFSVEESHKQLVITAASRVSVNAVSLPDHNTSPNWQDVANNIRTQSDPNWQTVCQFVYDSPRINRNPELAAYASLSFEPQRPILAAIQNLNSRVHHDFAYDKTATHVNSTTEEAFKLRKGVCQDFAHIIVGCLRSIGIPARYVSGYLRTLPPPGKPRLVGADQSHAWASVYAGPEVGWVAIDPTNDCFCDTDHIPIAWGRDYGDVVPIRGVFLGGGKHTLSVSVDVCPVDEASQPVA